MSGKSNAARYARMSVPHEDLNAANAALTKFYDAVEKAREEFRIADVNITAEIHFSEDDQRAQSSIHFGSRMNALPMLARAYGAARERHDQILLGIIADAREQERSR